MSRIFNRQRNIRKLIIKLSRLPLGQFRRASQLSPYLKECKQFVLVKCQRSLKKAVEEIEIAIARLNHLLTSTPQPTTHSATGQLPRIIRYSTIKSILSSASAWSRALFFGSSVKFTKPHKPDNSGLINHSLENCSQLILASSLVPEHLGWVFLERAEELLRLVYKWLGLPELNSISKLQAIEQYRSCLISLIAIASREGHKLA